MHVVKIHQAWSNQVTSGSRSCSFDRQCAPQDYQKDGHCRTEMSGNGPQMTGTKTVSETHDLRGRARQAHPFRQIQLPSWRVSLAPEAPPWIEPTRFGKGAPACHPRPVHMSQAQKDRAQERNVMKQSTDSLCLGEACLGARYSAIWRQANGLAITANSRQRHANANRRWQREERIQKFQLCQLEWHVALIKGADKGNGATKCLPAIARNCHRDVG